MPSVVAHAGKQASHGLPYCRIGRWQVGYPQGGHDTLGALQVDRDVRMTVHKQSIAEMRQRCKV